MSLNFDVGVKESSLSELERLAAALRSVDASLASLGKGNLTGLDAVNQGLTRMRREAAVGIQGIRNDLAEIAASGGKMAGQLKKTGKEVGDAAAAASEEASKGIDKYTARLMVGSAKIVESQNNAAERERLAAEKRKAQLMVGSAKIAEAQAAAAEKEEQASSKWRARMMLGSAKIAEAQEKAAQQQIQAAEKQATAQRRADAMFRQSQEKAADEYMRAVDKRLAAQRRADSIFEAAQLKAAAERARASAGAAVGMPAASVISGGNSIRGFDPGDAPKLKALTAAMNDAHSAARGLASGFNAMFLTWGNLVPLLAGAAISNAFVQTIKLGAEVSNTFAVIKNLSEETTTAVQGLNAQMLDLARNGPFGPREVAEAMKTLSLAGLNAKEVGSSIKDVLNFAVAGDTSIKAAADVMSSVATAFKVSADGYNYVGDVIAKTAAVSKSSIESIGESFKTASVINSQYGASLEDVGTGLALLSNLGIQGTAAGTALRNMYVDLLGRTPKVEKALEKLGVSAIDPLTGKARDMVSVFKDLDKALQNFTPEAQSKLLSDVFSERGGKAAIAALDALRQKAKEAGTDVASYLEEMRQKIADSAGFMAIAAANMALTPLNQMKSVAASFQATMVEAFDSLQPYIVSMSQDLKRIFASEDFKRGLQDLVVGVAEVTKFLVEHAAVIVTVIGAYAALKAAMAIGALMQAGAVMAAAYSTSLSGVASAQVAVATASVAASRGVGVLTASMAAASTVGSTVMAGVSGLMTLLSRLSPWIMAAVAAWQLYSFWTDKSAKSNADYSGATHKAYIDSLQTETQRLQDLVAAKRENISVDEIQRRRKGIQESASDADQVEQALQKVRKAEAALAGLRVDGPATNMTALGASRARAQAAVDAAKADYEKARNDSNARYAQRQFEEARLRAAADNLRREEAAEAKRRQDEFKSGNLTAGGGKEPKGASNNAYDRNPFTETEGVYKAQEKALKEYLSTESKLLNARRSEQIINEGAYQAQLLMLTSDSEQAQLQALKVRGAAADAAYTAERERIKSLGSADEVEKRRLEELEQRYGVVKASITAETEAIRLNIKERRELATIRAEGEVAKLDRQTQEFWAKDQTELDAAKEMEAAKERLRYASAQEIAQYEATVAAQAKYAREAVKIRTALDNATQSQYEFNQALMSGTSITPEMEQKARELGITVEELNARLKEFNETAADRAAEAGIDAANKVLRDKAKAMSDELSNVIVDGLVNGGKQGGKALREWLKRYFIQEPLTILVRGVMGGITGAVVNGLAGGAASAVAGGAGSGLSILGGVGSLLSGGSSALGIGASYGATSLFANGLGATLSAGTQMIGAGSVMSGIGTIAGALGPIALGIAALYSLIGSTKGETRTGGQFGVAYNGSVINQRRGQTYTMVGQQYDRDFTNGRNTPMTSGVAYRLEGDPIAGQEDALTKAVAGTAQGIDAMLQALGSSVRLTGYSAGLETSGKGRGGVFAGGILSNGMTFGESGKGDNYEGTLYEKFSTNSPDFKQALSDFTLDLKQSTLQALQTVTDIPDSIKAMLKDKDIEGMTVEAVDALLTQINDTINGVASLRAAFEAMGLDQFAEMAFDAAAGLAAASGGFDKLQANLSTYYDNFYSEEERKANMEKQIAKRFAELGLDVPKSREEYRRLVEESLAKGQDQEKARKAISGAMAEQVSRAVGSGVSVQDMAKGPGWASILPQGKDASPEQLDALQGVFDKANELAASGKSPAEIQAGVTSMIQLNSEVLGIAGDADKTSAALLELSGAFASVVPSAEEVAQAARDAIDAAFSVLEAAVQRENDALKIQRDLIAETVDNLQRVFDLVSSNARELWLEVSSTADMVATQAREYIRNAVDTARNGGQLDADALGTAISSARSGMGSKVYASQFERDRDRLLLAGELSTIGEYTSGQLTVAQRQLNSLNTQIEQNEQILDYWRKQIEASRAGVDATISVADAVDRLTKLMFPDKPAGSGTGAKPPASTPVFGPGGAGSAPVESKYNRPVYLGTAGVGYSPVTDAAEVAKLDQLATIYHKYDGTGDLTGLLTDIKANGGTIRDLEALSGYYASDWRAAAESVGIPAFDVGTNYVPRDMLAVVHKGEAIVPKAYNPAAFPELGMSGFGSGLSEAGAVTELRLMRAQISNLQAELALLRQYSKETRDFVDDLSEGGNAVRVDVVASVDPAA